MSSRYHFVTEIRLEAPPDLVWQVLARSETWPSWWSWLKRVDVLAEGDSEGLGRKVRNVLSTPLRYRLSYQGEVIETDRPRLLRFEASGDLEGSGRFRLRPDGGGGSEMDFHWLVRPARLWMRLLGPVARPFFVWSHDVVMTDFARGLARVTGSHLSQASNRSLRPSSPGFFDLAQN